MTTAFDILAASNSANDADARATDTCVYLDQDWDAEATFYYFSDGSVLVSSGGQVNAFHSMPAARAAIK
jgi:hypothetical protein